jgi:hypothetical protein
MFWDYSLFMDLGYFPFLVSMDMYFLDYIRLRFNYFGACGNRNLGKKRISKEKLMVAKDKKYNKLLHAVQDYVKFMDKINEKRVKAASRDMLYVRNECAALNFLQQTIDELEGNGVSED